MFLFCLFPPGRKCTYGLKCKYYHPERVDQSQLSVADELRAKSKSAIEQEQALHQASINPASTLHPYSLPLSDTGRGYSCSGYFPGMVPCVGQEGRSSPVLRSSSPRCTGSPAHLHSSLHSYNNGLSVDSDLGFSSLEGTFSRMLLEPNPHQYPPEAQHERSMASSGVGSSSHTSGGFYSSGGHRMTPEVSEQFDHPHNASLGLHAHDCGYTPTMPHGAYPPLDSLFSHGRNSYGRHDQNHMPTHADDFYPPHAIHLSLTSTPHQGLSKPHRSLDDTRWGDETQMIRAQLSTIFPQSTVDHVMRLYPYVQDRAQLITLIKRHKTSY